MRMLENVEGVLGNVGMCYKFSEVVLRSFPSYSLTAPQGPPFQLNSLYNIIL
jgi:hypothetical protein